VFSGFYCLHKICKLLCLASFTYHALEANSYYSMYHYFVPFHGCIIFHCMHIYIFTLLIDSSAGVHLSCFYLLAIVNSAAMSVSVHVPVFSTFLCILGWRISKSYAYSVFNFLGTIGCFSTEGKCFYVLIEMCKHADSFTFTSTFVLSLFFTFFFHFSFIIHMCIQGLVHFSPLPHPLPYHPLRPLPLPPNTQQKLFCPYF